VADGTDRGIIATETSPAFTAAGTSYSLALADIAGLGDLLGGQNLFLAEATFDLDGDPATTGPGEGVITVRTAAVLGIGTDPVTLIGTSRGDLLFGSTGNDTIDGSDGNDLIVGGPGDDVLIGGAGRDALYGGAGDDRLVPGPGLVAGEIHDGGDGRDVLALMVPAEADGDLFPSLTLSGIEAIDLGNGAFDRLFVHIDDVLDATDGPDPVLDALLTDGGMHSMMIYGDANDELELDPGGGTVTFVETVSDGEETFDVYHIEDGSGDLLAALAVDQDISFQVATA
jgi:Ca2+-binding RTX toxin-like protein